MYADMDVVIEEHLATYQDGVIRDFIDAYVAHHKSASPDSSFYSEEGSKFNVRLISKHPSNVALVDSRWKLFSSKSSNNLNGLVRRRNRNQCDNFSVGIHVPGQPSPSSS